MLSNMARRRFSQPPVEDFPMTPMIDMVFLLLVFFMTVSTLAESGRKLKLDLAESSQSQIAEDLSDRGVIGLDAAGVIYLAEQPHSLAQVQAVIKHSLAQNPQLKIQLRADAQTPYQSIKVLLRACAEVGAQEVIYSTYQLR